jgi:phage regulator Rha-like protein
MSLSEIHNKIFEIRGLKIMLDFDLAELYEVETRRLNEQVKRNTDKFPEDFMFRLTAKEWEKMQSQIAIRIENSNLSQIAMSSKNMNLPQNAISLRKHRGKVYTPYAFTEHGVTMLASVLRSKKAIAMNIAIVRAFTAMRHFANSHKDLFEQINDIRKEMQTRIGEHDSQLAAIYTALENLLDTEAEKKAKENAWKNRKRIGYK